MSFFGFLSKLNIPKQRQYHTQDLDVSQNKKNQICQKQNKSLM